MNLDFREKVGWALCRVWCGRLAGFIIYFYLTRLLTPEEIGLFSTAFAIFAISEALVDQGLMQAVVQRRVITVDDLSTALLFNLSAAFAISTALWLGSAFLERSLMVPGLARVISVGSIVLMFSSAGLSQEAVARREFRFRLLALRTVGSTVISGVVGIALAVSGYGVWALVAQMIVAAAITTVTLWLAPGRHAIGPPRLSSGRSLLRFGRHITGARLIELGNVRGTELLIASSMGAASLGLYAVGTKLYYIFLQLIGSALVDVAEVHFAKVSGTPSRLREAFIDTVGNVAIISTPVWIILSACAPDICLLAFGNKWTGSAMVQVPFALLGTLQVLQLFEAAAFSAAGCPGRAVKIAAYRAIFAFVAVWLSSSAGLNVVALAYSASQIVLLPMNLRLLEQVLGIRPLQWVEQVAAPFSAGLCAWSLVVASHEILSLFSLPPLARLIVQAMLGSAVYLILLMFLARTRMNSLLSQMVKPYR